MSTTAYQTAYSELSAPEPAQSRQMLRVWLTIPIFCFLFMLLGHDFNRSLLLDEGFNVDESEMQERIEEGMFKYRLAFLGIGFVGTMLLVAPGGDKFQTRGILTTAIVATMTWGCISVLWSADPSLTIRRVITLVCSFVGMLGVGRAYRVIDICILGFAFTLAMAGLGVVAEIVLGTFRPWEFEYRFAGLVHPNTQGIELSILLLTGVVIQRRYPKWRPFIYFVMAAAIVGLAMTKSRTSAACCLLGFVSLWTVNTSARVKFISLLFVLMIGGLLAGGLLSAGVDDPDRFAQVLRMGREQDNSSFTGRIPIWVALTSDIAKKPWTGYGFNTFFDEEMLAYMANQHEWAVPNAHNAYIECVLNVGFVGLGLLLFSVFTAIYFMGTPRVRAVDEGYAVMLALAVLGLLNGGFESTMVINFNFPPCLLAASMLRLAFFEDVPSSEAEFRPPSPQIPRKIWT